MKTKSIYILSLIALVQSGCGNLQSSILNSLNFNKNKVECSGEHEGFYVCLSSDSIISNNALEETIILSLEKLSEIVNTDDFKNEIVTAYSDGDSIVRSLDSTNYIVKITGYCDESSTTLATAELEGSEINYNECRVQLNSTGQPGTAHVAGVLLHEISHNIGFTHSDTDPSPTAIPYFLGDLIESKMGGSGHSEVFSDGPSRNYASIDGSDNYNYQNRRKSETQTRRDRYPPDRSRYSDQSGSHRRR